MYARCCLPHNYLRQPASYRRQRSRPAAVAPRAATTHVNRTTSRSADSSMTIGWLNVQSLTNKIDAVISTITDISLDAFALSETWHSAATTPDFVLLRRPATPSLMSHAQQRSWRRSCHHSPSALQELLSTAAVMRHVRGGLCQTDNVHRPSCSAEHLPARFCPSVIDLLRRTVICSLGTRRFFRAASSSAAILTFMSLMTPTPMLSVFVSFCQVLICSSTSRRRLIAAATHLML